jgi:hypothetical protein
MSTNQILAEVLKETLEKLRRPEGVDDLRQRLRNSQLKQTPPSTATDQPEPGQGSDR